MLHEIMMEIENEVGLERGAETMLEVTLHCDKKFTMSHGPSSGSRVRFSMSSKFCFFTTSQRLRRGQQRAFFMQIQLSPETRGLFRVWRSQFLVKNSPLRRGRRNAFIAETGMQVTFFSFLPHSSPQKL